jgi:hypothetical protein
MPMHMDATVRVEGTFRPEDEGYRVWVSTSIALEI